MKHRQSLPIPLPARRAAFYAGAPAPLQISLPPAARRGAGIFARASKPPGGFAIRNGANSAEIDIYDDIGWWGVSAEKVRDSLRGITAPQITLRINSRGGDVFDGIAIHNDLVSHPARVSVLVTGLAASAASIIAMAGDEISVPGNAFLMIHNAWTGLAGNRNDFLKMAADLQAIDTALARTYMQRSGLGEAEVVAMMDAETWLDGEAALAKGLATAAPKPESLPAAHQAPQARLDLSLFSRVPPALMARHGNGNGSTGALPPAGNSAFQAELARLRHFTASLRA